MDTTHPPVRPEKRKQARITEWRSSLHARGHIQMDYSIAGSAKRIWGTGFRTEQRKRSVRPGYASLLQTRTTGAKVVRRRLCPKLCTSSFPSKRHFPQIALNRDQINRVVSSSILHVVLNEMQAVGTSFAGKARSRLPHSR